MHFNKGMEVAIKSNSTGILILFWVAYLYKDKFVTERILHYPAAQTCGFSFLSHFGDVVIFPIWY